MVTMAVLVWVTTKENHPCVLHKLYIAGYQILHYNYKELKMNKPYGEAMLGDPKSLKYKNEN